eukprot:2477651-Pleurochrysis_carterae.AAC.1
MTSHAPRPSTRPVDGRGQTAPQRTLSCRISLPSSELLQQVLVSPSPLRSLVLALPTTFPIVLPLSLAFAPSAEWNGRGGREGAGKAFARCRVQGFRVRERPFRTWVPHPFRRVSVVSSRHSMPANPAHGHSGDETLAFPSNPSEPTLYTSAWSHASKNCVHGHAYL